MYASWDAGEAVNNAYALLPIVGDVGGGRMEAREALVGIAIWGRSCTDDGE